MVFRLAPYCNRVSAVGSTQVRGLMFWEAGQPEPKFCPSCQTYLPRPSFHRSHNVRRVDGLSTQCKACKMRYMAEYQRRPHVAQRLRDAFKRKLARQREADPELLKDLALKAAFGMEPGEYARMLAAQGGKCAICGTPPPPNKRLCVDHCHQTAQATGTKKGSVRGLLCSPCNRAIGALRDDPVLLRKAATYLDYHRP